MSIKASSSLKNTPVQNGAARASTKPPRSSNGNSLARSGEQVSLTSESKQLLAANGTPQSDYLNFNGRMPNLIEAFGGDDTINLKGGGKSQVSTGEGDDIVQLGGSSEFKGPHDTTVDGGKGNDALFVGQDQGSARPFHVVDEHGKTVASTGTNGDRAKVKNVETVFADQSLNGSPGDDTLTSDFKGQSSGVKVIESHNLNGGAGNDKLAVKTGDNGTSQVNFVPGSGDNKVDFDGGRAADRVSYYSDRVGEGDSKGSDVARFRGGEGPDDQLNLYSRSYSLSDRDGKVLSKQGAGADRISVDGFEKIWVNGKKLGSAAGED